MFEKIRDRQLKTGCVKFDTACLQLGLDIKSSLNIIIFEKRKEDL